MERFLKMGNKIILLVVCLSLALFSLTVCVGAENEPWPGMLTDMEKLVEKETWTAKDVEDAKFYLAFLEELIDTLEKQLSENEDLKANYQDLLDEAKALANKLESEIKEVEFVDALLAFAEEQKGGYEGKELTEEEKKQFRKAAEALAGCLFGGDCQYTEEEIAALDMLAEFIHKILGEYSADKSTAKFVAGAIESKMEEKLEESEKNKMRGLLNVMLTKVPKKFTWLKNMLEDAEQLLGDEEWTDNEKNEAEKLVDLLQGWADLIEVLLSKKNEEWTDEEKEEMEAYREKLLAKAEELKDKLKEEEKGEKAAKGKSKPPEKVVRTDLEKKLKEIIEDSEKLKESLKAKAKLLASIGGGKKDEEEAEQEEGGEGKGSKEYGLDQLKELRRTGKEIRRIGSMIGEGKPINEIEDAWETFVRQNIDMDFGAAINGVLDEYNKFGQVPPSTEAERKQGEGERGREEHGLDEYNKLGEVTPSYTEHAGGTHIIVIIKTLYDKVVAITGKKPSIDWSHLQVRLGVPPIAVERQKLPAIQTPKAVEGLRPPAVQRPPTTERPKAVQRPPAIERPPAVQRPPAAARPPAERPAERPSTPETRDTGRPSGGRR